MEWRKNCNIKVIIVMLEILSALIGETEANLELARHNEQTYVRQCIDRDSAITVKCGNEYRVTWINWQPYFSGKEENGTKFSGMFKKMLDLLQLTCKDGCRAAEIINIGSSSSVIMPAKGSNASSLIKFAFDENPLKSYGDLMKEIRKEKNKMTTIKHPRLFLPVAVTESYKDTVEEFPFLFSISAKNLLFVERKVKGDMLSLIWQGVIKSWELLCLVLLLAALFGMVVWLAERYQNDEQFPYEFSHGASVGFWYTCVTMTTVGYGDKTPKTFCGRITTLAWMLISLCLFPLLMANFTNLIRNDAVNSLFGVKVAVLENGPEGTCARKENADVKEFASIEKVLDAVYNKEVAGALIETNSAIFERTAIENRELRISRPFQCDLRIGIVAEPRVDFNNSKSVVASARNLNLMERFCLKPKCRDKLYGEAIKKAQKRIELKTATSTTSTSSAKLVMPLAILGGAVGFFIILGLSYDLFNRQRFSIATDEAQKKTPKENGGKFFRKGIVAGSYVSGIQQHP